MRNLKKFLALVLATLMVVSVMVVTTSAADATADHSEAVALLNRVNVYLGYGADMGADDLVTRWHMALFVSRMTTGFTDDSVWNVAENKTPFTDVTTKHYLGAIASAYNAGIIEGVGGNKFNPDANIKYQDALTMAVRALGYNDLAYPLGYIAKAQELGLTDGLNELDNKLETAVTRGQTAEILANALFATAKNGTVLAKDVLKLDLADVVVVATENQTLAYEKLAGKGKVIVAGDDVTIELDAALLLEDGEVADDLLGYSYQIATNNNWQTLVTAFRCDSDVFVNFGTESTQIYKVIQGYAPNIVDRTNMIKLNGVNHYWGTPSQKTNFEAWTIADIASGTGVDTIFYYDSDWNIVDLAGNILLYYMDGKYYISVNAGGVEVLRAATKAEIEACKQPYYVQDGNTGNFVPDEYDVFNCYDKVVDVADIIYNQFCEMKVFDDDGDGDWDRGIFTPYYIGVYGTANSSSDNVMNYASNSTSTSNNQKVITIDGTKITGYKDDTACSAVLASGVTFAGTTPAVGDTVVYTWNAFTGVFEVIENLGTYKKGNATELNGRGSYVVIDGTKYSYALTGANLLGYNPADVNLNLIQTVIVDKTYVIEYLEVAGYIVETNYINPYGYTNYVAFTWSDIVKVDADNNLVVNAIVDATGVKKQIKISDVNNYLVDANSYRVGLGVKDYLVANNVGAGNDYIVGSTSSAITNANIATALMNAQGGLFGSLLNKNIYAAKLNANGTYSLVAFDDARVDINVVNNVNATTITLNYGINDKAYVTSVANGDSLIAQAGKFDTTSDATYIFVGNDKIDVYNGVAANGSQIFLATAGTVVLNANADCVFVVNTTVPAATLYNGANWTTTSSQPIVNSDYVFYAITKDTKAVVSSADANGNSTLMVTNFYNVLTDETVDLIVKGNHATVTYPMFQEINGAEKDWATVVLYSAHEGKFEIISDAVAADGSATTPFAEFEAYLTELWAGKEVYLNVDLGDLDDKYSIDYNGTTLPVQSYSIKTFWGYEGTVEVIDGSVTHDFETSHNAGGQDYAFFWKNPTTGHVTGFAFAYGMSSTVR